MRTLFYLSESQLERIKRSSLFPGVPCVDDQRVVKISDMLSSMDFSGRMLLKNTGRTKRCIIDSSDEAISVFSA